MLQLMKNSLYVFLAACSFGILSSIVKLAYQQGFTFQEVTLGQFGSGWLIMLILMLFFSRKKVKLRQFIRLAGVGACTCLTGVFYYLSLQSIPASIAVVLLFQFTWIGVVIEVITTRQRPSKSTVISILLLFLGTVLAGGIIGANPLGLSVKGVFLGLMAAVMMALFIFFSGRVETALPTISRSFCTSSGSLLLLLLLHVTMYGPSAVLEVSFKDGLWIYGLILGIFGVVIPVLLLALGAPKISIGLASILSAGELPVAILASIWLLNEKVSILQWVGIAVILVGIAYPQFSGRKQQEGNGGIPSESYSS
ncbi:DMT family transporter [Paenibacillus provencensis]|uniref:DMT family transporter n=1 Tax=Paenibacillus provencensis TaxID=441151 RepID=A0ABW3PXP6_9BACL|nr:DMT family transporter [Paenibacillus sp. MER 78]MCM3128973.1 DMT family transporter [Paenibacillus sp. MER 78]